ncbi:MAG: hypothetical protein GX869_07610 [Candidatus Cloacimonetes bacterium]|nr:hypothetical protein [Candidatus Cloacimonadota bacterium]
MDDQRLERIEHKLDKVDEKLSKLCSDIQLHEYRITELEKQNNCQEKELRPLSNARWILTQIPSIVAIIVSLLAIIKAFGAVP